MIFFNLKAAFLNLKIPLFYYNHEIYPYIKRVAKIFLLRLLRNRINYTSLRASTLVIGYVCKPLTHCPENKS